jgi:hypothetical protein
VHNLRTTTVEYNKLKNAYKRYLRTYKELNGGSLTGAISFLEFYHYINFTSRYSDPRSVIPMGFR